MTRATIAGGAFAIAVVLMAIVVIGYRVFTHVPPSAAPSPRANTTSSSSGPEAVEAHPPAEGHRAAGSGPLEKAPAPAETSPTGDFPRAVPIPRVAETYQGFLY